MPYLDDATMNAIESDLQAAHQSLAGHGDFDMKGATKTGIKILETVVPAAAFSYMNARAAGGELKIGPVPVDLGVGLALALLAMFDVAGGYEEDLLNVGIGALASYGARTGAAFGAASLAAAQPAPATATSGLDISGAMAGYGPAAAHGAHNQPQLAARLRHMHHHVAGPVQAGTERYHVQRIG